MSAQIYELIPKVMAEVGAIEKARRNEQQKYMFRGIDDVFAAFQPVLAKHRIFYVPEVLDKDVTERETKNGTTLIYTTLAVAYTFYAPDGSNVRAVVVGEAMDSGDKSSNKAMSAALKYALLQIFCVPTEANEDADSQSHEIKPKAAAATGASRYEPVKIEARFEEAASPTLFWSLQREYGIPKEQAQAIAAAHGQDWKTAVAKLKALIPEPRKEQVKAAA
jgi:hypothetical protein